MATIPIDAFHTIREASFNDLDFLNHLEQTSFSESRRSGKSSLRHSIASSSQLVLVIEGRARKKAAIPMGAAVLFRHKRSIRIYSIAVERNFRMLGLGEALMRHIIQFATSHGYERITLEADLANHRLVSWYKKHGFDPMRTLNDFYGPSEQALKMVRVLSRAGGVEDGIVVVVDDPKHAKSMQMDINVCSAKEYLSDTNYANSSRFHVLNLCHSYKTHSIGYYVSLLASARNHLVVPSVMAIKDAGITVVAQSILDEIKEYIYEKLESYNDDTFELTVVLGKTERHEYDDFAKKLFSLFSIPFFTICFHKSSGWKVKSISILNVNKVLKNNADLFYESIDQYCRKKQNSRQRLRKYKYDLAILVNMNDQTAPSCPIALERFSKAAEKIGFYVERITKDDQRRICEFDALFIRETTAIDNHTYAMSRHAYTEGLVVIDDPWSIMLCSNKVYLRERFVYAGICQPRGWLLTNRSHNKEFLRSLPLPLVLKLPESTFSLGVFLANTFEELESKLHDMFKSTDLVIAQEFLRSEYDWRIGILDNTPLFACNYYMAANHWQVCNWQSKDTEDLYGTTETIPLNQVPGHILKAAVNASMLIGNGLYGVDLKDINNKAYVIEVNDNPNIDAGFEDKLLGNELYERIMLSLFNRIEAERQQIRYLY